MAIRMEELSPATQKKILEMSNELPPEKQVTKSPKNPSPAKAHKISEIRDRPVHAMVILAFVAVFAYALLGSGWLIGAIGDAIYEMGVRMHTDKWGIK